MIRSPLLFRYLFREVSIATSASFAVVCVILFYGNVARNDEYFLQALFHSPETFFTLSGLLIPYAAAYALPLGFVVGLLLSLGRMSADKEILAMRTVGLGMGTLLCPVILLSLLFSVLSVFLVGEWGPRSRALFDLRKTEIVLDSLDLILKRDGVLTFDIPSPVGEEGNTQDPSTALRSLMGPEVRRCGLAAGNVEGDVWRDLRLSFRDASDRMVGVLSARSAKVRRDTVRGVLALHLEGIDLEGDFNSSVPGSARSPSFVSFESWSEPLELPLMGGSSGTSFKRLGYSQLYQAYLEPANVDQRLEIAILLNRNLALGCSPICLAIMALPLSIRVGRRETMLNAGIALCVAMFYFFLVTFLPDALRDFSNLRPALWSWVPNVLCMCGGACMLAKPN
jgi:lipopolysaccharide export system permease protein